jgi:hypothetical protein
MVVLEALVIRQALLRPKVIMVVLDMVKKEAEAVAREEQEQPHLVIQVEMEAQEQQIQYQAVRSLMPEEVEVADNLVIHQEPGLEDLVLVVMGGLGQLVVTLPGTVLVEEVLVITILEEQVQMGLSL